MKKAIQSIPAARLCRDVSNFDLSFVGAGRRGCVAGVGAVWVHLAYRNCDIVFDYVGFAYQGGETVLKDGAVAE